MSLNQRETVICKWNETSLNYPSSSTLPAEISRQARQTPGKVAIEFANNQLTYQQLEQQSNRIARCLQSKNIGAGDLVGICVERSHKMLVYLLGILKSGASVSQNELRDHVRASLPPYMVPQHFVHLPQMPHTDKRRPASLF